MSSSKALLLNSALALTTLTLISLLIAYAAPYVVPVVLTAVEFVE